MTRSASRPSNSGDLPLRVFARLGQMLGLRLERLAGAALQLAFEILPDPSDAILF
jgi:hypothetical protein